MRSLKPASSNNGASRRLTLLHLVCAAALFSFLVFVIQSSFFAGSSFFNSLCFPLPFISIIIFSHLFFSFLVPNFRLSPASCRSQQGRGPDFVGFPVQRSAMRGLYIMLTFTLIAFISCSLPCCWTMGKSSALVIISNVVDFWIKWIYWFQRDGLWYRLFPRPMHPYISTTVRKVVSSKRFWTMVSYAVWSPLLFTWSWTFECFFHDLLFVQFLWMSPVFSKTAS